MTLRERQADLTRTAILDATAELLMDDSAEDLTMQLVAERAGISERTLYRYYPSRRELTNAMGRHLDERYAAKAGWDSDLPQTFDQFRALYSDRTVQHGVENEKFLRRALVYSLRGGEWYSRRDDHLWDLFREQYPNLAEHEARGDFAIFRHIVNSKSVVLIGERFGLDPDQLRSAMNRAENALLADIATRDRAAKKGKK